MWKLLGLIQKNLVWSIPVVMIVGIVSGYLFDLSFLKVTVMPLTFLMVYPMMVNLQIEAVFSPKGIKPQLVAQFLNFAVIPFIAFFLAQYFFPTQPLIILGMLFVALLPTSGMTIYSLPVSVSLKSKNVCQCYRHWACLVLFLWQWR